MLSALIQCLIPMLHSNAVFQCCVLMLHFNASNICLLQALNPDTPVKPCKGGSAVADFVRQLIGMSNVSVTLYDVPLACQ